LLYIFYFRFKPLKYKDIGKEIFQIEMPVNIIVPNEYMVLSKTKTLKRYWTPELRKMVNEYLEAKETLAATQESAQAILYEKFSNSRFLWRTVIDSLSVLDCLCSLALFSKSIPEPRCVPKIVENSNATMLIAESLRHSIVACYCPDQFVANDIHLSSEYGNEHVMILTGANMGGKSTLLRQVGLAAILAQLGAWVPAERLVMTPFDRIFTRLGANDNIIGGESTFKVELSETSKILNQCTDKSLVIIDELGRGTSTFDGVSIAEAVLHYLIEIKKSCVLFSTHYNMICSTFSNYPNVGLHYLNCLVNEER
jgi:DNA mismatch repair protein MSH6